ncbi:OmpA family protein [Paracoccus sp. SCSIO 75233]|uniref:OmpA family protein n=1 Tax=Paracoccus sp. SCSIO 75233 TaxID=3017782 RepID=UPI0022EFEB76|nr:OmpA family protein [Paracoccus sp. SCSIO 75233]WBU52775.1 OmpA family protein [Paracoccus sp. SCSIO 75233]
MTLDLRFSPRLFARHSLTVLIALQMISGISGAQAQEAPVIPAIPAIIVPDFIGVEPVQQSFEDALGDRLAEIDGIRIAPARCDEAGAFTPSLGMVLQDDSGIIANLGDDGTYIIDQDGSGIANLGDTQFIVEADGSGTINRTGPDEASQVQITIEADGSGTYSGPLGQISLDGMGGGAWNSPLKGQISVEADGSGTWNGPLGQISNEGDGSGTWNGEQRIINNGDGTGLIEGDEVQMAPLPPVPPLGRFPLLTKFRVPPAACGYVITLDDSILFDFDKSDLREDATTVVDTLASAFVEVSPPRLEIRGHTDSKGSADYNQDLSERRAMTVGQALKLRDVRSEIDTRGFGLTQPVAPNDINGVDNPAGRQLNRRVEIYVPNG